MWLTYNIDSMLFSMPKYLLLYYVTVEHEVLGLIPLFFGSSMRGDLPVIIIISDYNCGAGDHLD